MASRGGAGSVRSSSVEPPDPLREMLAAGSTCARKAANGEISFKGTPPSESLQVLRHTPFTKLLIGPRTMLSDLSAIEKTLKNPTVLDVTGSQVKDVSALRDLKSLKIGV